MKRRYRQSIIESDRGECVTVALADTWYKRLRGFKSRSLPESVNGVLIFPCASIHTIGMTFDIDVYFLDKAFRLMSSYTNVGRRRCIVAPGAYCVLELKSGEAQYPFIHVGEHVQIRKNR